MSTHAPAEPGRASLLAFMAEREAIRLRRASGAPPPWTDDGLGKWDAYESGAVPAGDQGQAQAATAV